MMCRGMTKECSVFDYIILKPEEWLQFKKKKTMTSIGVSVMASEVEHSPVGVKMRRSPVITNETASYLQLRSSCPLVHRGG